MRGAHVVNVDVSRRYLEWTEDNFALNRLDLSLNESVDEDARTYVQNLKPDQMFDGIIVDPPTAAQGKAGFWSVRKDFQDLLQGCFEHLKPGGVMLASRNDRHAKEGLAVLIHAAAERAKWALTHIESAPPSLDFPTLDGFPEGTRFEGWLVS